MPSLSDVKTHLRVDFSDDDTYIGNVRTVAYHTLNSIATRSLALSLITLIGITLTH